MSRILPLVGVALVASGITGGVACGHSSGGASTGDDAGPFTGRAGDLGVGGAVIDHGGPNGGVVGTVQSGALGDTWQPAGCPGTVPVATGVSGAQWGAEAYGTTDKSPHAVHTSFRFDTSTTFAVVWETDADTQATWVAYGDSPQKLDHFVQGVDFVNPPSPLDQLDYPMLVHETHVCGLEPQHTYYYAVGGDGWWGNVESVTTAPAQGSSEDFRFLVMGDSNAFYDLYASLQVAAGTYAPQFTLFTGDLIHEGSMAEEWESWFTAGGNLLATIPTMTVHGNHEAMATGYFALWALPGIEEIYSFDWGSVHFVVLNDTPTAGDSDLTTRQAQFLDADLTAAEARPVPPTWIVGEPPPAHVQQQSRERELHQRARRMAAHLREAPRRRRLQRALPPLRVDAACARPRRRDRRRGRHPLHHLRRRGGGVRRAHADGQPVDQRVLLGPRARRGGGHVAHAQHPGQAPRRDGHRGDAHRADEVAASRPQLQVAFMALHLAIPVPALHVNMSVNASPHV